MLDVARRADPIWEDVASEPYQSVPLFEQGLRVLFCALTCVALELSVGTATTSPGLSPDGLAEAAEFSFKVLLFLFGKSFILLG